MASKGEKDDEKKVSGLQKSYFDVLGLCCSSEVPLIEKILKPLEGVVEVSVIVPTRTVIVLHDANLISQDQILKALNQARLEANVRVIGKANYKARWPSPYVMLSGLLLALSFLKYVYHPLQYLAVAAVAVGIWPIIMRGVVALRNLTLDVNILVLIAVISTLAMKDFPEAGTIVFLFTIAEWLESRASQKATAVMTSLLNMAPQKATIAETGEVVNVEDVKLNTVIAAKAGEVIPVDGIVVDGTCEVDEKTLTGESFPVPKQKDSIVWAGTVNVNGYISVKTTALAQDCAVAKMARLVEEAQNSRSTVQRLIDKCAKFYTPAVVLISAGLAVVPIILKLHNLRHWFYLALVVLVSACPCGLILSTPVATFCALSRAATSGLLIKGGDYLEILAKVKVIAFDKTGTITRGEFTLMNFLTLADDVSLSTLLYWVSSIESKSSHPVASVLVDYGRSQSVEPKPENVEEFQNFPGEGIFGRIDGREIYIGNKKLGQRAKCTAALETGGDTKDGRSSGYIYSGGAVIGTFSLSDNCRSGAVDAIKELKAMGIKTALLTGDGQSAAMYAQEQLGRVLDVVHAELLPEDKARIIKDFKKEGPTAMVGDGVNDAPALATADIGISMGVSGSALATETGHVILMSNDIRKIPKAIKLARKTRRKVIQNILISLVTKAGVLAFAFAWRPYVWLAVLVDVGTCLIVIGNSMLLLRGGHAHGRKWLGLFPRHSHKSKCHSTSHAGTNDKCCSKSAAPKTCDSARCSSQHFPSHCQTSSQCCTTGQESTTKNQQCCPGTAAPESCESARCFPHNHPASCKSSSKCHSTASLHLSAKSQLCSPKSGCKTISEHPQSSMQKCSSSCQTNKSGDLAHQGHQHLDVPCPNEIQSSHASLVPIKSLQCSFYDCVPECQSSPHSTSAHAGSLCGLSDTHNKDNPQYHQSTCCQEDHCLDSLESQISCGGAERLEEAICCGNDNSEAVKHEIKPECHHKHSEDCHGSSESKHHLVKRDHHHHHEHKTCSEGFDVNKTSCGVSRQNISGHCSSDALLHSAKNFTMCEDLCSASQKLHEAHHCFMSQHPMCHNNAIAKHACTSLMKREVGACCKSVSMECCSAQGHFAAGFGLTEIVTE